MVMEEYKQLSCSDVGMACGFQIRAKTEAEVMKHARTPCYQVQDGFNQC